MSSLGYGLGGVAPRLPSNGAVWIAPGARVVGDVRLEEGASVWFGAVLRGDTEPIRIGPDSNIQDGCVVHTDPGCPVEVAAGVTVGHNAILHGCVVAENVLIGMGAILLNGARVGRDCIVGAGALIVEGATIPPGSLVLGVPARVVREVRTDEIAGNRRSAKVYRERAEQYRRELCAHPAMVEGG